VQRHCFADHRVSLFFPSNEGTPTSKLKLRCIKLRHEFCSRPKKKTSANRSINLESVQSLTLVLFWTLVNASAAL